MSARFADGLRQLADVFESGVVPAKRHEGQAVFVGIQVGSLDELRAFATATGAILQEDVSAWCDEVIAATATLALGEGVPLPNREASPEAYASAVRFRVTWMAS